MRKSPRPLSVRERAIIAAYWDGADSITSLAACAGVSHFRMREMIVRAVKSSLIPILETVSWRTGVMHSIWQILERIPSDGDFGLVRRR